jgi:hypothetical protein
MFPYNVLHFFLLDGLTSGCLLDVPGGVLITKHFFNIPYGLTICNGQKRKHNICSQPDVNQCNRIQLFVSMRLDRNCMPKVCGLSLSEITGFGSRTMTTGNRAFIRYFFYLVFLSFKAKGYRGWEEELLGKTGFWRVEKSDMDDLFRIPPGFSSMLHYLQNVHGCAICGVHFASRSFPPPYAACYCTYSKRFIYNSGDDQNAFETYSLPRLMSLEPLFNTSDSWYRIGNGDLSYAFISDRLFDVHAVYNSRVISAAAAAAKGVAPFYPRVEIFFRFKCADAAAEYTRMYMHREILQHNSLYVEKIKQFGIMRSPTTLQRQLVSQLLFQVMLNPECFADARLVARLRKVYSTKVLQDVWDLTRGIQRHSSLSSFFDKNLRSYETNVCEASASAAVLSGSNVAES